MSTVSGMALRLTPSRRCLRAFIASTPVLSTAVAAGRLRQQAEDLHNRSPDRTNPFSITSSSLRSFFCCCSRRVHSKLPFERSIVQCGRKRTTLKTCMR